MHAIYIYTYRCQVSIADKRYKTQPSEVTSAIPSASSRPAVLWRWSVYSICRLRWGWTRWRRAASVGGPAKIFLCEIDIRNVLGTCFEHGILGDFFENEIFRWQWCCCIVCFARILEGSNGISLGFERSNPCLMCFFCCEYLIMATGNLRTNGGCNEKSTTNGGISSKTCLIIKG